MQKIQFDYFTGMEAEQYSFYRVPKVLFTEPCFKTLSCEAKVLYGLMLDRMSLSIKNRWLDSEDRVYIIFTVEEIAELMNCGTQKAVKLVKELDSIFGVDKYTVENKCFRVLGYDIEVKDTLLAEAIQSLSENKRKVVLLSYFMDMSDADIARMMNLVRSTVYEHRKRRWNL